MMAPKTQKSTRELDLESCTLYSNFSEVTYICCRQPYHPAAEDRLPTEAKQGWAGQYLDGRPPGKTRLQLEEVLVKPAGGAHPAVCVGPNAPG